jgi:hypothetical protein
MRFLGEPCSRCFHRAVKQRAVTNSMCSACWAGATELQRRSAIFDEGQAPDMLAEFRAGLDNWGTR